LKSPPRWIYGGGSLLPSIRQYQSYNEEETDPGGRGTCVLSRAVGSFYGVSKASDVVVVKLPSKFGSEGECHSFRSSVLEGLAQIRDDIILHNILPGKGVINVSLNLGSLESFEEKILIDTLRSLIEEFTKRDIPLVAASGNRDIKTESHLDDVNTYPALFGSDKSLSIIVVGSTNGIGIRSPFSQGSKNDLSLTTSAIGEYIRCPPASGLEVEVAKSGTSFC